MQVRHDKGEDGEHSQGEPVERSRASGEPRRFYDDARAIVLKYLSTEDKRLHEQPERERDQRDIEVAKANRQEADQQPEWKRDDSAEDHGGHYRPTVLCRQNGRRHYPDTGERRLAEPDHPSLSGHQS